jgi:hypothetical protein
MAVTSPYLPEAPEAETIRSLIRVARSIALLFAILFAILGLAYAALVLYDAARCATMAFDPYCGSAVAGALGVAILLFVFAAFAYVLYVKLPAVQELVRGRQYERAKSETLLWAVIGLLLAGVVPGIFLLLAYLKFDPLLRAPPAAGAGGAEGAGGYPVAGSVTTSGAPPPSSLPRPTPPPPPSMTPPTCPKCGMPGTYIAQYSRFYCYTDQLYL